jgi:hypothetical protein
MMLVDGKRGSVLHKVLIHIILIAMLFGIFLLAMDAKFGSRGVKQQVLEKQLALLIDAADEGASFEVRKKNVNGLVDDVSVSGGRIFVGVDGLRSSEGYPYFSSHLISAEKEDGKFIVRVG